MKKIIALLLAVTIMTSTATVWAQELQKYEKGDIRVINLSDSITEDSISEIKNSINAGVICKEDSTAELETVITIEDISTSNARNILTEEANCYKVTIETSASGKEEGSNARKVVSDSGDKLLREKLDMEMELDRQSCGLKKMWETIHHFLIALI